MPLYEYRCSDCSTKFEMLRGFSAADNAASCPNCGGMRSRRLVSMFASVSKGEGGVTKSIGGGSCSSCASSSCATCH